MDIEKALRLDGKDLRITCDDRWLVYAGMQEYDVYEKKKHSRGSKLLFSSDDFHMALYKLINGEK